MWYGTAIWSTDVHFVRSRMMLNNLRFLYGKHVGYLHAYSKWWWLCCFDAKSHVQRSFRSHLGRNWVLLFWPGTTGIPIPTSTLTTLPVTPCCSLKPTNSGKYINRISIIPFRQNSHGLYLYRWNGEGFSFFCFPFLSWVDYICAVFRWCDSLRNILHFAKFALLYGECKNTSSTAHSHLSYFILINKTH